MGSFGSEIGGAQNHLIKVRALQLSGQGWG
jgi:hypothetical protein